MLARAVKSGDAKAALSVGVEQSSVGLKSKAFRTAYDIPAILRDVRASKWFMSVFLRFMLSDGAGAFLTRTTAETAGHLVQGELDLLTFVCKRGSTLHAYR